MPPRPRSRYAVEREPRAGEFGAPFVDQRPEPPWCALQAGLAVEVEIDTGEVSHDRVEDGVPRRSRVGQVGEAPSDIDPSLCQGGSVSGALKRPGVLRA
jgi:hypothetical protein